MQQPAPSPISALPSPAARFLAFLAILVAGVCGGLIGWSVTDLQCGDEGRARGEQVEEDDDSGCSVAAGIGGVVGAGIGAGGTAVIAVLVLRAMGEWRQNVAEQDDEQEPPGPVSP